MADVGEPRTLRHVCDETSMDQPMAIDRRLADRIHIALPLTYAMDTPGGRFRGKSVTCTISGTGVQFAVPALVPPETRCHLDLVLPQPTRLLSFCARVVWCKPRHRRKHREPFEVGVALTVRETPRQEDLADYYQFIASHLLQRYLR